MAKKIYVASSWRNEFQPEVVKTLRALGHEVYDFRNPPHGRGQYRENLNHPIAEAGFKSDLDAMLACDVCVLVLPCGRSAHTEAGWYSGAGRPVYVYQPVRQEPELMYKLFSGGILCNLDELKAAFAE